MSTLRGFSAPYLALYSQAKLNKVVSVCNSSEFLATEFEWWRKYVPALYCIRTPSSSKHIPRKVFGRQLISLEEYQPPLICHDSFWRFHFSGSAELRKVLFFSIAVEFIKRVIARTTFVFVQKLFTKSLTTENMLSKVASALAVLTFAGSASAAVEAYGKCGGADYTGETTCVAGFYCFYSSEWYSVRTPMYLHNRV